jgi:hypothetical protein
MVLAVAVQVLWGLREHHYDDCCRACNKSKIAPLQPLNASAHILEIEGADNQH